MSARAGTVEELTAGGRFSDEAVGTVRLQRGRESRVSLTTAPNGRVGVTVREWITEDAYRAEDRALRAHKRCYVGPDGKRGSSLLSASQALELAEMLVVAGRAAELTEGVER